MKNQGKSSPPAIPILFLPTETMHSRIIQISSRYHISRIIFIDTICIDHLSQLPKLQILITLIGKLVLKKFFLFFRII